MTHALYLDSGGGSLLVALVTAVPFLLGVVALVRIVTKAGFSGWWVLTAFVPLLNVLMFLVFAFGEWPALRDRRAPTA